MKFPSTPKQGIFFLSLIFAKYLAKLLSTIVYRIIEFVFFSASSRIFMIWFSVLVKEYEWTLYSMFKNCALRAKNILSKVSPVESDIK